MDIKQIALTLFSAYKLLDNPFSATPMNKDRVTIWAGRKAIKNNIEDAIKMSLISSPSRILICYGEWGTGKTHAMRFFTQPSILDEISSQMGTKKGLSIGVLCPRESVLDSLYREIIRNIGLDKIRDIIKKVAVGEVFLSAPETQVYKIKEIGFSETTSKIFQNLIHGDPNRRLSAERYLFLEATSGDINNLKVSQRIRTKNEKIAFLTEILKLFLYEDSEFSRIYIWIDEMEHIDNFGGKDLMDMRSFLRSLIDIVPSGLTLFLNGTFKAADDFEGFLDYLGPAIRDRIYRVIPLPFLEKDDSLEYVNSLLNNPLFRDPSIRSSLEEQGNTFFPFNKDTIEHLYDRLESNLNRKPTPRNLNDALTVTMENYFLDTEKIESLINGESLIDQSYIDEKWDVIKIRFTRIL